MKNKGFTLMELLAVITLLAIILMIVIPSVLRSYDNSKENLYKVMVDNICDSTSDYYKEYKSGLIQVDHEICTMDGSNEVCTITISDLIKEKYLNQNLRNPLTEKDIVFSDVKITITSDGMLDTNESKVYIVDVTIDGDKRVCNY